MCVPACACPFAVRVMASNTVPLQATQPAEQQCKVDVDTCATILDMGVKFCYRIPSFSVFNVDLRQVEVQLETSVTVVKVDAFIRADPALDDVVLPFCVHLNEFCFVSVRT